MGQSAGAVHVAEAVVRFSAAPAGALLVSGIYDVASAEPNQFQQAYYGADPAAYPATSTMAGLVATDVPLLVAVSEFDPPDFQRQTATLAAQYAAARKAFPRLHWLGGHNHLSPVLEIGAAGSDLERHIRDFIAAV